MSTLSQKIRTTVRHSRGFTLLEVLVAMVVVTLGLLGIAALQGRALNAEMEAYQRAQATVLLNDMVDRINANRMVAGCFPGNYGVGSTATVCGGLAGVDADTMANADVAKGAWDSLLKGEAEKNDGVAVGALLNARGCVTADAGNLYHVAVAWQGLSDTSVPAAPTGASAALGDAIACGSDQYGTSDAARRLIWTSVRIADLDAGT